jgi:Rrf2 family protein
MKFSTRSSYGLRALINLARNSQRKPYSLAKIAKQEKISLAYLERLFSALKKAGLVASSKGMAGGYKLTKEPVKISILSVIQALEGQISVFHCLGEKGEVFCGQKCCPSVKVYQAVQLAITSSLKKMTLADLIKF